MTNPAFPASRAPAPSAGGPNAARFVAGFLWLVAAGLAVVASFVPFYRFTQTLEDDRKFEYAVSGWSWNLRVTGDIQVTLGPPSLYGIPLVLAGVVLLMATIVAFTRWSPRAIGMLGAGLIVGAVSMELVDAVANNGRSRENLVTEFELGTWLLIGSAALAIIGAVLAFVRTTPKPQYQQQQMWPPRVEPETPRFGFPAPTASWPSAPNSPSPAPTQPNPPAPATSPPPDAPTPPPRNE